MSPEIPKRLDPRAVERTSGPAWQPLYSLFLQLSEVLLDAHPEATSALTTIYVKFETESPEGRRPFAVVWLKRSSELAVGLALPHAVSHARLIDPPAGMKYPLLTRFLILRPGDSLPPELAEWSRLAVATVATS